MTTRALNVLLVEDSEDDAALITRALQKHGLVLTIERVETAAEFERALSTEAFDAILADFSLPRFSGIEALHIVRERQSDVPFIVVSGTIGEQMAVAAMKGGAHDYVMKQSLARLGPALERELAEAEVRRARLRAEAEIREREEWLRALIEEASDAIAVIDTNHIIRYEAPTSTRMLGLTPEELVGTDVFERIHGDDRDRVIEAFRRAAPHGQPAVHVDYQYRHGDGRWRHLESTVRNLTDHPAVRGLVMNSRDVTERKLIEAQLEQAQRLASLGHLAATVAHEFNNVLMGIQPFAEIARRQAGDNVQLARAAASISSSIARGSRITQEILRFTQPANLVPVSLDLARWLQEVRPELESLLGGQHRLTIRVDDDIHVHVDPGQLFQAVVNLAVNARDAMSDTGTVTFSAAQENEGASRATALPEGSAFVRLSVSDTGTGIDDATMKHIFEPLFTTKRNGTGLGLPVTRQIIERHGGRVVVESSRGEGSTFHLFLPAGRREAPRVDPPSVASARLETPRVLLVEDDPAVANGLASLLAMEGFIIEVVSTGGEASDAIARFEPHALVLDVGLPDIDGIDLYHQIHPRWPRLPVIFSTGHGDRGRLEQQLKGDNVRMLLKPYDSATLIELLESMVRASRHD